MDYHAILMTIIAFSAVISVLSVIFNWLLTPLKENQARLEEGQKENQARLEELRTEFKKDFQDLKEAILK